MNLKPTENELVGQWLFEGGRIIGDAVTQRIKWLLDHHLVRIASDRTGWDTLYKDPDDDRYWEHFYPHGEMQGGGPPALRLISEEDAEAKYGTLLPDDGS